jgi:hypothetical protein
MKHPGSGKWQKWLKLVERQRSSGMSVASFCAHNGVAVSSLYAWRRRVAAAPAFVEAKLAGESAAGRGRAGVIEVRVRGGRRVRVRSGGFDRDLLPEVVAALESLPRRSEAVS